jgi:hypothetical protein
MPNFLILNQNYIQNGLGTLTYTVATTGNYNIQLQATLPSGLQVGTGAGGGSGRDQGLGTAGGFPGASSALQSLSNGQTGLGQAFPNVPANNLPSVSPTTLPETTPNLPYAALGSGTTGLGFGGTANDGASGFASGYGAGAGGGGEGFVRGDFGPGFGGVGQGFGAGNGYQQPAIDIHESQTSNAGPTSSLSIVVNKNGSPIYTSTAPTPTQNSLAFRFAFQATATDSITVVLSSANAADNTLEALTTNLSIGQGL